MKFYGFEFIFDEGKDLQSRRGNAIYEGDLHVFDSKSLRDEWVAKSHIKDASKSYHRIKLDKTNWVDRRTMTHYIKKSYVQHKMMDRQRIISVKRGYTNASSWSVGV